VNRSGEGCKFVNEPLTKGELDAIRRSAQHSLIDLNAEVTIGAEGPKNRSEQTRLACTTWKSLWRAFLACIDGEAAEPRLHATPPWPTASSLLREPDNIESVGNESMESQNFVPEAQRTIGGRFWH